MSADAVICLTVPRDVLTTRLLARAHAEGRPDDTASVIVNRLDLSDQATRSFVDDYRERRPVHVVDGDRPPEQVTAEILGAISLGRSTH